MNLLITLIMLSIIVILHELGHYLMAKKAGVFVEEFAIGMGPKIVQYKGQDTLFSLRIFPIGGFCRMYGELDEDDDGSNEKKEYCREIKPYESYQNKSKKQKFFILIAGPMMNFLLGFICLYIAYSFKLFPHEALLKSIATSLDFFSMVFNSFYMLVMGQLGANEFVGPVGLVSVVGQFTSMGIEAILVLCAMLSINVGVFNLLPIPGLDGGQITILILEKILKKEINPKWINLINIIGVVLLIVLMIFIMYNDILRIFT